MLRPQFLAALTGLALLLPTGSLATTMPNQNLELRERTGENLFARNVYVCNCTTEQFHAVPLPGPNWEKNAPDGAGRLFLADTGTNTAPTPPPGVPTTLDLIPEIPGPDHTFIARVLNGTVLGVTSQAPVISASVARDTIYTFNAGRVIHMVTSPTGDDHVLFSVVETITDVLDLDTLGALAPVELLPGWSYTSELLAADRTFVVQNGIAEVVSYFGGGMTFQKIYLPEPTAGLLLAASLLGLAARRRS